MHHNDIIMGTMTSQITSLTIDYSTVYPVADQRKHQSSASLTFVWGIHRWPVNSPHKWPITRKCFHFMTSLWIGYIHRRTFCETINVSNILTNVIGIIAYIDHLKQGNFLPFWRNMRSICFLFRVPFRTESFCQVHCPNIPSVSQATLFCVSGSNL